MPESQNLPSVESLLHPISKDTPAGVSVRNRPEWNVIRQARTPEDSFPLASWQCDVRGPDWLRVEALCVDVLTRVSKDMQVASWLSEAWMHLMGIDGLLASLSLLTGMHERYLKTMFPNDGPRQPLSEDVVEYRWNILTGFDSRAALRVRFMPVSFPEQPHLSQYTMADVESLMHHEQRSRRRDGTMPPYDRSWADFQAADDATPREAFFSLDEKLRNSLEAIARLENLLSESYGEWFAGLKATRQTLERVRTYLVPKLHFGLQMPNLPPDQG